jgi:hypothetical protein
MATLVEADFIVERNGAQHTERHRVPAYHLSRINRHRTVVSARVLVPQALRGRLAGPESGKWKRGNTMRVVLDVAANRNCQKLSEFIASGFDAIALGA